MPTSSASVSENVRLFQIDANARVLSTLIRVSGACVIFYFGYLSIKSLSGRETLAKFIVDWATDLKLNQWMAWLLSGGMGIGWARERKLRIKHTASLADQKRKLEERIDPERTSSKMPATGRTRAGD